MLTVERRSTQISRRLQWLAGPWRCGWRPSRRRPNAAGVADQFAQVLSPDLHEREARITWMVVADDHCTDEAVGHPAAGPT
jgi:hypothetical protein